MTSTLEQAKPIVLVHERQVDKGGGPLEVLLAECRAEMREAVFSERTPITWHRIYDFQLLTLKLIATEMLRHSPPYAKAGGGAHALELVLPGEVELSWLVLPHPVVLWCSAGNPGAAAVAQELVEGLLDPSSPRGKARGHAIRVVDSQPDVAELDRNGETGVLLLYLNAQTWTDPDLCGVLERDVSTAKGHQTLAESFKAGAAGSMRIVLVHENDPARGGWCAAPTQRRANVGVSVC